MTATAPASSAMRASSGVVTSMITPPLSIWARPTCAGRGEKAACGGVRGGRRRSDSRCAACAAPQIRRARAPLSTHTPTLNYDAAGQGPRSLARTLTANVPVFCATSAILCVVCGGVFCCGLLWAPCGTRKRRFRAANDKGALTRLWCERRGFMARAGCAGLPFSPIGEWLGAPLALTRFKGLQGSVATSQKAKVFVEARERSNARSTVPVAILSRG